MAKSSSTGFEFAQGLAGAQNPSSIDFLLDDSTTLKIGDAVRVNTDGIVARVAATYAVLGICTGIVDENGINPFSLSYINATGSTLTGDDTVVTASDNSTRAHALFAQVAVDPAGNCLWLNDADGDLAQTNICQMFDVVAASGQISQSSASDTSGQFQLIKIDPQGDADASKGLFRISEPQLMAQVGNATTGFVVVAA